MMTTRNIFAGLTELRRISHPSSTSSSVLYASALLSVCVDSTENSSFAVWRCRVQCWIGRVCLHPQNVSVLGASSWGNSVGWVAEGSCSRLLGTRYYPRDPVESHNQTLCLVLSVFFTLRKQLFTPLWHEMFLKPCECTRGSFWFWCYVFTWRLLDGNFHKNKPALNKACLPFKALLNILKIAKHFW